MRNKPWFVFALITELLLCWRPSYGVDPVIEELVKATQSSDSAIRSTAEAKLRTLLQTLIVPETALPTATDTEIAKVEARNKFQLENAVEQLTTQLTNYEKRRKANAEEYARYTENMRADSRNSPPEKDALARRYEGQRDASNLNYLFQQFTRFKPVIKDFTRVPKTTTPGELVAQKAFIKLLMPQFTSFGPNSYMIADLENNFGDPLYRVPGEANTSATSNLFYDEMKEIHRKSVYVEAGESSAEDFKVSFKKLLKSDPYAILPTGNREARLDALANILLKASGEFNHNFELKDFLRDAEGKTVAIDKDKKRIEFQIDRFDIAARMVERMGASQLETKACVAVTQKLLDFLGVYRRDNSGISKFLNVDDIYRGNGEATNERNAIVQAKSAWLLSLLLEHVRSKPELQSSSLSPYSDRTTIGSAIEGLWSERATSLGARRTLADQHCVLKLSALLNDGPHTLVAPK